MEDPNELFYQQSTLYEDRSKDAQIEKTSYDWRYQTFLKLCISKPNQSLLDIGCGEGVFMAFAQSRGFCVFGIDIDDRAIRLAKNVRNLEHVETGRWENLRNLKGWKDFDTITLFDMLEHVSSPVSLITAVFELLKPCGLVCITVPRWDRYPRFFDAEVDFPPHHFTLWTSNALSILLNKVGFKEIRIIQKPLIPEDLFLHLIWRKKRFIRKLRTDKGNPLTEKLLNTKSRSMPAKNKVIVKLAKRSILFALTVVNWFLWISRLGRGHTLLAIARKL